MKEQNNEIEFSHKKCIHYNLKKKPSTIEEEYKLHNALIFTSEKISLWNINNGFTIILSPFDVIQPSTIVQSASHFSILLLHI